MFPPNSSVYLAARRNFFFSRSMLFECDRFRIMSRVEVSICALHHGPGELDNAAAEPSQQISKAETRASIR